MKTQIKMPNRNNLQQQPDEQPATPGLPNNAVFGTLGGGLNADQIEEARRILDQRMLAFNMNNTTSTTTAQGIWQQLQRDPIDIPMPTGQIRARRAGTLTRFADFDSINAVSSFDPDSEPEPEIPALREIHDGETIDLGDAVQLLENTYRAGLDKKGLYKNVKTEVVVKEPDPINDSEEVIVNYVELADVLATNRIKEVYGQDATPEEWQSQYNDWIEYYSKIILENKRKTNV